VADKKKTYDDPGDDYFGYEVKNNKDHTEVSFVVSAERHISRIEFLACMVAYIDDHKEEAEMLLDDEDNDGNYH